MKGQDKNPGKQLNEVEIGNLQVKGVRIMIVKMIEDIRKIRCWILIARILLRIFASMLISDMGCSFPFLWHLCQVLVLGVGGLME